MKLFCVLGGPPSLSPRITLKMLNISHEIQFIDFNAGEHLEEFIEVMNPQRELPILDDDGFYLGESTAIMQYICDKYGPTSSIYPNEPKQRAIVNHRLSFNTNLYYSAICMHLVAPIYYAYPRNDKTLQRMKLALSIFEKYLQRTGTKYVAGDNVTIADFALITSTMCMEAAKYDFKEYSYISEWYSTFKAEHPTLWTIVADEIHEIADAYINPPVMTMTNHPIHPIRKN